MKRREVPVDQEFWTKVAAQERIREVVLNGMSIVPFSPAPREMQLEDGTDLQNSGE